MSDNVCGIQLFQYKNLEPERLYYETCFIVGLRQRKSYGIIAPMSAFNNSEHQTLVACVANTQLHILRTTVHNRCDRFSRVHDTVMQNGDDIAKLFPLV